MIHTYDELVADWQFNADDYYAILMADDGEWETSGVALGSYILDNPVKMANSRFTSIPQEQAMAIMMNL